MQEAECCHRDPSFPCVRGRIVENAPLGMSGWFKAGGGADILFKPADRDDLAAFLRTLQARGEDMPVRAFGVLSNTIVRDGGVRGVSVRLGGAFAGIEILEGGRIRAGAMALDSSIAKAAAQAGIAGLEFFSGIPGTIGGALRMNAGCYGMETKDVLIEAEAIDRFGKIHRFTSCHPEATPKDPLPKERSFAGAQDDMNLSYRHNSLPDDYIFTSAIFQGHAGDPAVIEAHMAQIREKREASQPIREKTGGSTFANPSAQEIAEAGLPEGTKVWELIDSAGCRGLCVGGAQMSGKHCNFMINTGGATGADLENLGEEVRRRVADQYGIALRWEIKRVGEFLHKKGE